MVPHPALTLVDTLAEETERLGRVSADAALRSQAASVRAIADEIGRRHPSESAVAPLHSQLAEELSRLAQLLPGTARESLASERVEVLVVDDDEPTLRAMAAVVRGHGHPYRTASDAEEALREYERRPVGIVLSDWNLPGMTGLALGHLLKQRDPHVYVMLVTAHSDESLLRGVHGGVDDFLRKPIDIDDLTVRLAAAERLVHAVHVVERVRDALLRTRGGSRA